MSAMAIVLSGRGPRGPRGPKPPERPSRWSLFLEWLTERLFGQGSSDVRMALLTLEAKVRDLEEMVQAIVKLEALDDLDDPEAVEALDALGDVLEAEDD